MDYFQPIFNKWSTCSVEDFQKLYDQHGSSFCWKSSDSNSTDTTTTTTTTTVSPATTTRVKPATTATTSKSENQQCIEFGGDRCMRNCKNVNFSPFQTCRVFTPAKKDCNCTMFGTPTTTPIPITKSPNEIYCKSTPSSCPLICKNFNYSATSVCRITTPKKVVCICSWFKP